MPSLGVSPSEYCDTVWYRKTKMVWIHYGEKRLKIRFYSLDRRQACDRQTGEQKDRQTSCHSIVCTMHMRHTVKINGGIECRSCMTKLWSITTGWSPDNNTAMVYHSVVNLHHKQESTDVWWCHRHASVDLIHNRWCSKNTQKCNIFLFIMESPGGLLPRDLHF